MSETAASPDVSSPGVHGLVPLHGDLRVVTLILGWKMFTFVVAYVSWAVLPFNNALRNANLRWGERNDDSFAAAMSTWDSQHYIRLAEVGYQPGLLTNAFGPLYPWLIRSVNVVTGDSVVSGLLIANGASGLALYLMWRFVLGRFGETVAWRTLVLFVAFPTAFYLNLLYTEGLFLLLIVSFFVALYERWWWLVAACCFLLPLLRLPGLVVALPLAWVVGVEWWGARRGGGDRTRGRAPLHAVVLLAPVLGLAVYFGYMHTELGNAFVAMDTEKQYISHRSLENLLRSWHLVADLFRTDLSWHGYLNSAMDRAFFVVMVGSLVVVWRKLDVPMALFATVIVLQSLLGSFMSYTRLAMVAFPVYIAWALMLEGQDRRLVYAAATPLLVLQVVLLSMHVRAEWVA